MPVLQQAYTEISTWLIDRKVQLVAVSKTKPVEDILSLYQMGQRDFGENYVQELVEKQAKLPADIRWHFIGHLQGNKVKYIVPFVHLIHGVDSLKLLKEINKQGAKLNRVIDCLLQVHIATEETKFGFDSESLAALFAIPELTAMKNIRLIGFMGMASNTPDESLVGAEFTQLRNLLSKYKSHLQKDPPELSMGMSGDYKIAVEEGSTLVRIGSLLFGVRS